MKPILLFLLLVNINQITYGQETKRIKNKIDKDRYEIYHVLKSEQSTKQGSYKLFERKNLKVSGFYDANKKDSTWTEYKYSGNLISQGSYLNDFKSGTWSYYFQNSIDQRIHAKGDFLNGKRMGIWNIYNLKGKLTQHYDFDTKKITKMNISDSISPILITDGQYKSLMFVDKMASYKNGEEAMFKFLGTNVRYPSEAKSLNKQGTVYISFNIDENGKTSDYKIVRSVHQSLDDEAMRVVKLMANNWMPASFEGEYVSVKYNLPIRYQLR